MELKSQLWESNIAPRKTETRLQREVKPLDYQVLERTGKLLILWDFLLPFWDTGYCLCSLTDVFRKCPLICLFFLTGKSLGIITRDYNTKAYRRKRSQERELKYRRCRLCR